MKKSTSVILGGAAILTALLSGYFFSQDATSRGLLFGVIAVVLLLVLYSRIRSSNNPSRSTRSHEPPMNLAFYGELNRLIDEGKDIGGYLRKCGAPQNIVKSVNVGGGTVWYLHKDGTPFDEFRAEFPHGEVPEYRHPYIKTQCTQEGTMTDVHIITVDLYRALWGWGEAHPQKKRWSNSMRLAFHGAYTHPEDAPDETFLDKTIEEVKAARKANKKNPEKKKKRRKR